ncbi:MAG: VOC family protein [Myxococcales bacterium]|nr:VOC family protein [Myxococcales bacterium]
MTRPPVLGKSHVAVVSRDLHASERFYVGTLGLPVLVRYEDDAGKHRSTWVDLDGAFLAIERAALPGPLRDDAAPGLHCLALRISAKDRNAWREHLAAAGISVERESKFSLYVRDPDGVLIGLSHYPEESAP